MATATRQNADIIVYIEGSSEFYVVRYEIRVTLDNSITVGINERLRKSFSLGRSYPDAYTRPAILRKAQLMQTIFRNEYGLTTTVVDLIID